MALFLSRYLALSRFCRTLSSPELSPKGRSAHQCVEFKRVDLCDFGPFEVHAMSVSIHIYPLSKLVHASAGSWESQLRSIEEGKLHAYRYYLPLREAVVSYCKSHGKKLDQILQQLHSSASAVTAHRGANPLRDNRAAFDTFINSFYPRIGGFEQSFL